MQVMLLETVLICDFLYVCWNRVWWMIPLVWVRTAAPRGALQWHGGNRVGTFCSQRMFAYTVAICCKCISTKFHISSYFIVPDQPRAIPCHWINELTRDCGKAQCQTFHLSEGLWHASWHCLYVQQVPPFGCKFWDVVTHEFYQDYHSSWLMNEGVSTPCLFDWISGITWEPEMVQPLHDLQ